MQNITVGQLLINEALPEDLRNYDRVLDKKGIRGLLREVAEKHPEKYRDVSFRLLQIGHRVAQETGGMSFGLRHMRKSVAGVQTRQRLESQLNKIVDDDALSDKQRHELIIRAVGREIKPQQEAVYEEAIKSGNPLALQVQSESRGNKMNLASLLGSDLLYSDHHDRPIPIPVLRSYSEGLSPEEYFAGAYGARKGTIATKFATQDAGFFGKQLNQVAHRLVVVGQDYDDEEQRKLVRGVPVDIDDMDNEGALLAQDTGPYKRNTALTPKILKSLARAGKKRILVRSSMVGGSPEGGVYARDVGVRERGVLPGQGEQVGLTAAQALAEPVSQGQLSAKHSGGVSGEEKAVSGFDYINQLVQVPKHFKGGAAHARVDGTVQRVEPAPAGGQYLTIDGEQHYVGNGFDLKVEKGDTVEAGDVLSEGLPNPSEIVRHKGVGEGRRYFVKAFREAMRDAGMTAHRRNVELLSRGLINHVRLTDEFGENVPDDVIPYSTLEHRWKPRPGHMVVAPKQAVGKYLEAPVLHYTIGTKVRPSMLKDFDDFGVQEVAAHDEPPPFEPEMIRGMYSLQHDPDWMTRMYGSGLKKGLLDAVQRGSTSKELGTSFVPSLARSVDFGRQPGAIVKAPEIGYTPSIGPEKAEPDSSVPFGAVSAPKQTTPRKWFGGKFSLSSMRMKPLKVAKDRVKQASMPNDPTKAFDPQTQSANAPLPKPKSNLPTGKAVGSAAGYQAAAQQGARQTPTATQSGVEQAKQEVQKETVDNPHSWASNSGSPNLMKSPIGVPMVQAMNTALPGMGGVVGLGTLLNAGHMSTLMRGSAGRPQTYGAAGYSPPGEGAGYTPVEPSAPTIDEPVASEPEGGSSGGIAGPAAAAVGGAGLTAAAVANWNRVKDFGKRALPWGRKALGALNVAGSAYTAAEGMSDIAAENQKDPRTATVEELSTPLKADSLPYLALSAAGGPATMIPTGLAAAAQAEIQRGNLNEFTRQRRAQTEGQLADQQVEMSQRARAVAEMDRRGESAQVNPGLRADIASAESQHNLTPSQINASRVGNFDSGFIDQMLGGWGLRGQNDKTIRAPQYGETSFAEREATGNNRQEDDLQFIRNMRYAAGKDPKDLAYGWQGLVPKAGTPEEMMGKLSPEHRKLWADRQKSQQLEQNRTNWMHRPVTFEDAAGQQVQMPVPSAPARTEHAFSLLDRSRPPLGGFPGFQQPEAKPQLRTEGIEQLLAKAMSQQTGRPIRLQVVGEQAPEGVQQAPGDVRRFRIGGGAPLQMQPASGLALNGQ